MGGLLKSIFVPSKNPSKDKGPPPPDLQGAANQAALAKGRQGRGLASTDVSGMRQMQGAYQQGKTTLGGG